MPTPNTRAVPKARRPGFAHAVVAICTCGVRLWLGGDVMSDERTGSSWDDIMATLKRERDELALKVHLGKQDAIAEWEKLEAKWNHLRTVKGPPVKEAAAETARG